MTGGQARPWYGEPDPGLLRPWQRHLLAAVRKLEGLLGLAALLAGCLLVVLALLVAGLVLAHKLGGWSHNAAYELRWHCFGALWLLACAHALRHDAHVRVDTVYSRLELRGRAVIDIVALLGIALPLMVLIIVYGCRDALGAWQLGTASSDGGLGQRWIIKAAIPLGALLFLLQALAVVARAVLVWSAREAHRP